MQHSLSPQESYFLNLIKRTPHLETLAKHLQLRGFPSIVVEKDGTRFQKCRRLYDRLHQHCFSYSDTRKELLKKVFYDSSNGSAAELLYSTSNPADDQILKDILSMSYIPPLEGNVKNILKIFNCAKIGNLYKMKGLMNSVAAHCAGLSELHQPSYREIDLNQYRQRLRTALLEKRDWSDKTLLHVAVDAKTTECVDVILRFAYEARAKEDLLDAEDAFGETALHRAVKKQNVPMVKKLIFEGSNLLWRNYGDEHPLQLILLRIPSILPFLMDLAITYNGDIYNTDTFCMNIDFTALITPVDIPKTQRMGLLRLKKKIKSNPTTKAGFHLDIDEVIDEESEDMEMVPINVSPENKARPQADGTFNPSRQECFNIEMSSLTYLVFNNTKACSEILSHPVAQTYLDLKWSVMKKFLLFINTGLRIVIYGLYVNLLMRIYFYDCPHSESKQCYWSIKTKIIVAVVIAFISLFLIQEVIKAFEIRKVGKQTHLSLRVWIRIVFFLLVMGTTVPPMFQNRMHPSQYSLATIGVLMGAGVILQVIGNSNFSFCVHSIYIHVYGKVMWRFLTVMITFFPLIASFAIVFNIIYPKVNEFSSFWRSLLRLAIMMQGEFDYQDILSRNQTSSADETNESNTWLFWTGQISFGLFGCILTLVLIDVFLGYTVSDIKELKTEAEFVSRCNQIKQIFVAEQIFAKLMSNKMLGRILRALKLRSDQCNVIPTKHKTKFRYHHILSLEQVPLDRRPAFMDIVVDSSS